MTDQELLTLCKTSLRLTTNAYDTLISNLISTAKDDISEACDADFDATNKNECNAVVLFVKGMFPYEPDELSLNLYRERLSVIGTRKIGTPVNDSEGD